MRACVRAPWRAPRRQASSFSTRPSKTIGTMGLQAFLFIILTWHCTLYMTRVNGRETAVRRDVERACAFRLGGAPTSKRAWKNARDFLNRAVPVQGNRAGRGVHEEKVKESCFVNGQLTAFPDVNGRPPFNGIPSFPTILHAPLGWLLLIVGIRISLSVLYFLMLGSWIL